MNEDIILMTGAAGQVGSTSREAIRILLSQGRRVRAMVRTLDERAEALREMGAEVVVADLLDIISLRSAMKGCSAIYFTMSVSPSYLEAAVNLAVTAKSLGVKAIVNLSQMTLSQMSETETTKSSQQKQHWLAEQVLRWSGLSVVYLRPTAFSDALFLTFVDGVRDMNSILLPFGDGKTSPIAASDVGAAVAAVLADPTPHIGKAYELTGPASMSMNEVAETFSSVLGRPIRYVNVPSEMWETKLREFKISPHLLNHLLTMAELNRQNSYDRMTYTFKELVGRDPISIEQFIKIHTEKFTPRH